MGSLSTRRRVAAFLAISLLSVALLPTAAMAQSQPDPVPAPLEANGVSADPTANSRDAIVASIESEDWGFPVQVIDCPTPGCGGAFEAGVYTPLPVDQITQEWRLCAALPHVKDPYWVGIDHALVTEATRSGVKLQVLEAGGYTNVGRQIDQVDNCVASGADAVLIGAVSNEALNTKIEEITDNGVVVIDLVNGVLSERVSGRALFDYCTLGGNLGGYLRGTGEQVNAVWFPGPSGVGSLEQLMSCFQDQAGNDGANVTLLGVRYGDTGKDAQLSLVENALETFPEMNYIVGSAVTAEAAAGPLAERGLLDSINTASYYFTPQVHQLLQSGEATCSSAGNDIMLGRVAVDMAIRVLEGQPFVGGDYIGMNAQVICGPAAGDDENLDDFVPEVNLPPEGFRPIFDVNY